MLSAVIFDFDGIIVDTEPIHCEAFREVLGPHGVKFTWEEYLETYVGYDDRDAIQAAFASLGQEVDVDQLLELIELKSAAFDRLVVERGAEPYPGVCEFIARLSRDVPIGLCSGALGSDVKPILHALDLEEAFKVMVTADEVKTSKPDPESYVLAVERLAAAYPDHDIAAGRSVAIEDTPAGIQAARGAGLSVLAVTNSYQAERLGEATRVVDTLEGLDAAALSACLNLSA
jgi:HAD superfamily hydrolase (TIGR01509 family)